MAPPTKPASTRARRNKTSTAATIKADPAMKPPDLPDLGDPWHPMTVAWWNDVWSSPMAPEFDPSDQHGLLALAVLQNDFWTADKATTRRDLAAEIRQQGQRFGLSPIDRRRLQWEIERTEEAQDKAARRRAQPPSPAKPSKSAADPRSVLRAV